MARGGGSATHKIISWAVCAFSPFVLFFFQSRWEVWSDVNQHAAECWMRRKGKGAGGGSGGRRVARALWLVKRQKARRCTYEQRRLGDCVLGESVQVAPLRKEAADGAKLKPESVHIHRGALLLQLLLRDIRGEKGIVRCVLKLDGNKNRWPSPTMSDSTCPTRCLALYNNLTAPRRRVQRRGEGVARGAGGVQT